MSNVLLEMISAYQPETIDEKKSAVKEVLQELILYALSEAGFFEKAAFYGGTALRIFYGLDRYSEDLDFSLIAPDQDFDLNAYIPALQKAMDNLGLKVEIQKKEKTADSPIQSAFLKGNTIEQFLLFYSQRPMSGINPDEKIKIKFELDILPPDLANFETRYRLSPLPHKILLYDQSSLFSGKIHAILCRGWKNRVKGRDLYDYVFYLSKGAHYNLPHLREKLIESDRIASEDSLTAVDVQQMLIDKFQSINFEEAKKDVQPFINDTRALDLWSIDFFTSITKSLQPDQ